MTLPAVAPSAQTKARRGMASASGRTKVQLSNVSSQTRLLLLGVACFWPLIILALFAASSPATTTTTVVDPYQGATTTIIKRRRTDEIKLNLRNALDRVDIMGYGPTHPRIAVVITTSTGDENSNNNAQQQQQLQDELISTTASVFEYTDLNRLFVCVVMVDGTARDKTLVHKLKQLDRGDQKRQHWQGLRPSKNNNSTNNEDEEDDDDEHAKLHVMFNKQARGIAHSRADGVEFIRVLQSHHEAAGLKSPSEDFILVLLQAGARLQSRQWLPAVTQALIVPPPFLGSKGDADTVSHKLANAVAFGTAPGRRTSFDASFAPLLDSEPLADEINLSSGASYPTPAWNGAAMAMRLDTYLHLPGQDVSVREAWPANLDLALNLWLCADGIDILENVQVTYEDTARAAVGEQQPLVPEVMARFAAAWMDATMAETLYREYTRQYYPELTHLEWETAMERARQGAASFPQRMARKCRSFQWYAEHVNPDLGDLLTRQAEALPLAADSMQEK